jgi:hypothetical protein
MVSIYPNVGGICGTATTRDVCGPETNMSYGASTGDGTANRSSVMRYPTLVPTLLKIMRGRKVAPMPIWLKSDCANAAGNPVVETECQP